MTPTRPAAGGASAGPALVSGLKVLAAAAAGGIAVGALVVLIAALASGGEAATLALIGVGIAVGVFAFGAFCVHVASALVPSAALLVALVTYTGQLVVVFAIFISLTREGGAADGPHRGWLAAAVVACTLAWLVVQLVTSTRQRIPLYDLPDAGSGQPRAQAPEGTTGEGTPGGEG